MEMLKSTINSAQIAKLAGVSRSTVSRVINNYSNVPQETREKVLEVIKQYNYYPNISARVLKGKKTNTIGLFMISGNVITDNLLNNYSIASVIENAALYGYHVLSYIINDTKDPETIHNVKEIFHQGRIDGAIIKGGANHEPLIEELIAEGFLICVIDQDLPGRTEKNRMVFNFESEKTAENAVDYVVGLNHRKIAVINGNLNKYSGIKKYQGFLRGIEKNSSKIEKHWLIQGEFNKGSGYAGMSKLLKSASELPTAVCAANDSIAFGAIEAINEYGLKVPEDISVIGIDDHILSRYFKPSLTTFKVDFGKLNHEATASLIKAIEQGTNEKFIKVEYDTAFIERESCRKI